MPSPAEEPLDPRLAPETLAAFRAGVFSHGGIDLPYRLLSPTTDESVEDNRDTHPLVLFLHGKGERGDDNQRQLIHGADVFADPAFVARNGAFVLAPQCPDGTLDGVATPDPTDDPDEEAFRAWTGPLWTQVPTVLDLDSPPTPELAAAVALVDELLATRPIDPKRVYVVGLSMGGYATWELATRHPERWAAAVPICGGGDPRHAGRLVDLPLWSLHGDADPVVPIDRSRELIAAIRAAGGTPIETEYEGVGHDSWTPTLGSRHVWDWLFAQRR